MDSMRQVGPVSQDLHTFQEKPEIRILCRFSWLLNAVKWLKLLSNIAKPKYICKLDVASNFSGTHIFKMIIAEVQESKWISPRANNCRRASSWWLGILLPFCPSFCFSLQSNTLQRCGEHKVYSTFSPAKSRGMGQRFCFLTSCWLGSSSLRLATCYALSRKRPGSRPSLGLPINLAALEDSLLLFGPHCLHRYSEAASLVSSQFSNKSNPSEPKLALNT